MTENILINIADKQTKTSTSILTLTELLSFKTDEANIKKLENSFSQIPYLTVFEVNRDIAKLAAKIRREHGFLLPDAIQLATAIFAKAKAFLTNDQRLSSFKEIEVILLQNLSVLATSTT